MPVFEAKGKLSDGSPMTFTVEAEDREDAKIEFSHSIPFQDGKPVSGCSIDFRTIRLSKESIDSHRERLTQA